MEELIACKKAVKKVMPGAPNVSITIFSFYLVDLFYFKSRMCRHLHF